MKIGIIGIGVVGGALLKAARQKGFSVVTYDKYKTEYNQALHILDTKVCFICVPTPSDGKIQDQKPLHEALSILSGENYSGVVAIKSTILPGTTKRMAHIYRNLRIVHNPEFLREVSAFEDTMNQPVVHIGAERLDDMIPVFEFWRLFDSEVEIRTSPSKVVELIKYMHNCFLATKVSFCNDIFEVCEVMGVDYESVISGTIAVGGIGRGHTKIAPDGKRGYGGHCFPKDMGAFSGFAEVLNLPIETIKGAISANKRRRAGEL